MALGVGFFSHNREVFPQKSAEKLDAVTAVFLLIRLRS